MTALAQRLKHRYFGDAVHPYRIFEGEVDHYLTPSHTLLDAGCGRTAPILRNYQGRARRLIGIDLTDFEQNALESLELYHCDLGAIPLEDDSVDVIMARSVMEHVTDPARVYAEMYRVLKPGGHFIFLTANLWDYASLVAAVIPNRFHPWIVARTEGRQEADVFPVAYRTNTRQAIQKWSDRSGFEVLSLRYIGQYPSYFMFNGVLFLLATAYEKVISRIPALNCLQGWLLATLQKPGTVKPARQAKPPDTLSSQKECQAVS